MKTINYLILALSVFIFASCSSNEEISKESIIGTWDLTEYDYDASISSKIEDKELYVTYDGLGENFDYSITFTETEYHVKGGYDLRMTITFEEDTQTETVFPIRNINQKGTYSFDGNKLIIDNQIIDSNNQNTGLPNQNIEYSFNLVGDVLTLIVDQEEKYNQSGYSSTVKASSVTKWKKQ